MCFDYDDYAEFSTVAVVRARKAHRCSCCRRDIAPGEEYERSSGKCDGGFYVEKLCRTCCYDRFRVVDHELDEGCGWQEAWPAIGDMRDYLAETGLGTTNPEDVPVGFKIGDMPAWPRVREAGVAS